MAMSKQDYLDKQMAAMGGQGTDYLAQATIKKNTPIDEVYSALSIAREVSQLVITLADRLAGSAPEDQADGKGVQVSDGLFWNLADNARSARDALMSAQAAVRRIEAQLP